MIYKQSGVALITVMLIIALATTTAVSMVSRQFIDIHRSKNVLHFEQAYQHTYSAEFIAKDALIESYNENNQLTTLGDKWNIPSSGIEVEGVMMSGFIEDLQARFNINSLVIGNQLQQVQLIRFQHLLTNLNIPIDLANKVVDWIDSDQIIRTNGAEDGVYLNKVPAYTTAGQPMADISELLLVDGMTADIYDQLKDIVCALDSNVGINVNTASPEVISSLANNTTVAQAKDLTNARGDTGFSDMAAFLNDPLFSQQAQPVSQAGLNLTSQYFRLTTYLKIGEIEVVFTSNLFRDINKNAATVALLNRSRSIL